MCFHRFFVLLALYIVGGIVFLYYVRGARGKEVIPNYEFWMELPLLIRVRYYKNKLNEKCGVAMWFTWLLVFLSRKCKTEGCLRLPWQILRLENQQILEYCENLYWSQNVTTLYSIVLLLSANSSRYLYIYLYYCNWEHCPKVVHR